MDSLMDILRDVLLSDIEKLKKINTLIDTDMEINYKNIDIQKIFDFENNNIQLKCDTLGRIFQAAKNIPEYVDSFISFLKQNSHTSVAQQCRLFNSFFIFSMKHLQFDCLCLTVEHINKEALTHEDSILRSREFWIAFSGFLENSQHMIETKKIIYILQTCVRQVKVEELSFEFLSLPVDDEAWKTFLALLQVCHHDDNSLFENSFDLLYLLHPLPFFWKHLLFKLLLKRSAPNLKCKPLTYILSQRYKEENIQDVSRIVFSTLKEIKHHSKECLIHEELKQFCDNLNEQEMQIIFDEIINMVWDYDSACLILTSVLTEAKNNTMEFDYFYRIVESFDRLLRSSDPLCNYWPEEVARRVITFFWDSEDIDKICEIKRSNLYFYTFYLPHSQNVELSGFNRILELSQENSDNIEDILLYFGMAGDTNVFLKMLKEEKLSIHVRLVTYYRLFNVAGYHTAETQLNQENTVNDFYEYLMKHLNENTYKFYKDLMINFLDLLHRLLAFTFPEDVCKEILEIVHSPERYTKYQIYCATDILKMVPYRFDSFYGDEKKYYKEVAEEWKQLILETDDLNIASCGLHYVLGKGVLDSKDRNEMVKKILETHICDRVAQLIYEKGYYPGYLNMDLLPLAYEHLGVIKEKCPSKYEKFSAYFCEQFVNAFDSSNDNFSMENEYWKFCQSNKNNLRTTLENLVDEVIWRSLSYDPYDSKIYGIIMDLYSNNLCGVQEKLMCLEVVNHLLDRSWAIGDYRKNKLKEDKIKINFKFIINLFKNWYALNFENNILKLRIVQALILLVPYIQPHTDDLKYKYRKTCEKTTRRLKKIAVGILVKESRFDHTAVKQICQYMYILLSKDNITFKEIRCILEKIKERPALVTSFIPVLYHVLAFHKLSSSEVEDLFSVACSLPSSSNIKEKSYVQILQKRLLVKKNEVNAKKNIVRYDNNVESEDDETDREKYKESLGMDYLFLDVLDPFRDHTVETILYTLPKLNQVDPSELRDVKKYLNGIRYTRIRRFTKEKDENETLHKAVDAFLENQRSCKSKYARRTVTDILQMFVIPCQNPVMEQIKR